MGFDFSRIEYDVPSDTVRIDGSVPRGWEFLRFELRNELSGGRLEEYVGVVARYIGGETETRVRAASNDGWLRVYEATVFLRDSINELGGV